MIKTKSELISRDMNQYGTFYSYPCSPSALSSLTPVPPLSHRRMTVTLFVLAQRGKRPDT